MSQTLIDRIPASVIISIPIILALLVVVAVALIIPYGYLVNSALFLLLFLAVSLSRMLEAWQFGTEIYHLTIFCFSYVYGASAGIIFVFLTSIAVFYGVFFLRKPYLTHTTLGPILQTMDLLFTAVVAGVIGAHYPHLYFPALAVAVGAFGTFWEKFFCHRFAGVEWGRLFSAQVVQVIINYNLFLFFGDKLIASFAAM